MESWGQHSSLFSIHFDETVVLFSDDDNFEPQVVSSSVVTTNKWVGEDEEENVKVITKFAIIPTDFVMKIFA